MPYRREAELYPVVAGWLESFLHERIRSKQVVVADTSRRPLYRAIQDIGAIPENKPEWPTYDILVDVTGFILSKPNVVELAFVECKNTPISLKDISQLLGYSRVAMPIYSCILSPAGISSEVSGLLRTYRRLDILEYAWPKGERPRSIVVGTWDELGKNLSHASLIHNGHPYHDR